MQIKDMFVKPIDREIQGVVMVGQGETTNPSQELEEYVVTRELQRHFSDFFEAYKKGIVGNTVEIGVWISGFFGSGKSHFLKILSYLLDDKFDINGKKAIDYFIEDNKISDPMVLADMRLASETPTDVILFDIDAKNDSSENQHKDAIVNVFLKVFNQMQGFCGSIPHLADLEAQLTEVGKYEAFKSAFEDEYGKPWIDTRHHFDFIQDSVVDALVDINFMSESAARNWCEKAVEPYRISIEDFAKRVKEYIDKKGNNHHVVFMVDEMGQYIGEDSSLMLNLQTVRHELSQACFGKAWVIVTSQQDVDSLMRVKGNDFSKIQGRFATRISMSSANVDEVIKKRILEKNETGAQTLRLLYEQKATLIKNLIVFNDSVEKKLYANEKEFADVYPFVPYQFNLLASVLTSVRKHGASGKHLSEGERSMLALFKESADAIKLESEGSIVPFHLFYDSLHKFLDHSHSSVIIRAYDNTKINPEKKTKDVFAINVLKTLFLIKYILEIEANVENITSLMISSINDDRIALKEKVESSLKILKEQSLIQKNGKIYIFLTDEEQEIDREIENQPVEMAEVINKVSEMIFEDIYSEKRYRYSSPDGNNAFNGRYNFSFNQTVDDRPYKSNQNYSIGLKILTPWYEQGSDDGTLRLVSGTGREVIVLLPNDSAFLEETRTYLKIEKFLRLNTSSQLSKYEMIKEAKRVEMRERNANAKLYLTEALKEATVYVNGDVARLSSKEVTGRINEALGRLVQTVYHKLSYIDTPMDEISIRKLFKNDNQISLDLKGGTEPNVHALDDVLNYIKGNSDIHMKTSMKTVKDRFMSAPYGFVDDDVHWLIAKLFNKGDLSFTLNGTSLTLLNKSSDEIIDFITKKQFVDKLLLDVRTRVPDKDKKIVQKVMKQMYGASVTSDDEDMVMRDFQNYTQKRIDEMDKILTNYQHYAYPGKKVIDDGKTILISIIQLSEPKEFYEFVSKNQDDLLDYSDDYEPVKSFFGGEQRQIFTQALEMLSIYDDSKTYIVNKPLEDIVHQMRDIVTKDNPYKDIPKIPDLIKRFKEAYSKIMEEAAKPVMKTINDSQDRVMGVVETKEYVEEKKTYYLKLYKELLEYARNCNNLSVLRGYADKAEALKLRLLNEMDAMDAVIAKKKAEEQSGNNGGGDNQDNIEINVPVKKTKNITIKSVAHSSSWRIESEADVDQYINNLRTNLLEELGKDDVDILNVEL
ncbi:hypothetical protein SAMN02910369_02521 [Lachnospiraceae bacterium NE2001]|nr:hypothetical protein SAMN02910369_02521 [Lachnospiraceae bacterium NE2001]